MGERDMDHALAQLEKILRDIYEKTGVRVHFIRAVISAALVLS